jgi:cytochrome P450 family 6
MQGQKKTRHSTLHYMEFYKNLKLQNSIGFGGIYFFTKPVVLPTSLTFLRNIFIKDFQHFHDRGIYHNEIDDPLSSSLSTIEGLKWKVLREKLTATFTSGKMKMMFPIMIDVAERLKMVLGKMVDENNEIEIKIILARFTTDIIGNCAFGIDCNCLNDPEAEFLKMGLNIVHDSRISMLKRLIMTTYPNLARKLKYRLIPERISNFFMGVVNEVIEHREKSQVEKNDFMNSLIQLKNTGTLIDDRGMKEHVGKVTMNEVAAQAFVFFLGGFETSSTTAMLCLHELSLHPDVQEKARRSVFEVFRKYGNELTYQGLSELYYLEQCINGIMDHRQIYKTIFLIQIFVLLKIFRMLEK